MEDRLLRCFIFIAVMLVGCSSSRKLSQVGIREPSSVAAVEESPLRQRLANASLALDKCPAEFSVFPNLFYEQIQVPECPEGFSAAVTKVGPVLSLEERSMFEEVASSQCRSFGELVNSFSSSLLSQAIEKLLAGELPPAEREAALALRKHVEYLELVNIPLDRWITVNSSYVLSESSLEFLDGLIGEQKCRASAKNLEACYQFISSLESFSRILQDPGQKQRVASLMNGMQTIVDKKVLEFFPR